jgi:hypothetical protein
MMMMDIALRYMKEEIVQKWYTTFKPLKGSNQGARDTNLWCLKQSIKFPFFFF